MTLQGDARAVAIELGERPAGVTLADGQRHEASLVVAATAGFGRRCSAVVTAPNPTVGAWLALPEDEFAARIEAQADERLGAMRQVGLIEHTDRHVAQDDLWMRQTGFASGNCHSTQHRVVLAILGEGLVLGQADRLDIVRRLAHELALWFPGHAQSMNAALALHLREVARATARQCPHRPWSNRNRAEGHASRRCRLIEALR